ncbi:hypothetical protein CF327_g7173 [Tilletia walkeri]|nr:hypothetical protein CF327_g7173 [Tilletia walkeri]
MTASSMSVNVHETYQTKRKAQPAVLSILAGIKSLAEFTAQQDKIQSGLDRTLTATRAEVDTAREEAGTPRELNKMHEATVAQLRSKTARPAPCNQTAGRNLEFVSLQRRCCLALVDKTSTRATGGHS